jgi:thiol-disulfide isomerase/thioredoxin
MLDAKEGLADCRESATLGNKTRRFRLFLPAKSPMKKLLLGLLLCLAPVVVARADVDTSKPLDLKFTAVDGTKIDLSSMKGKVVLIDFWATWCPPCRGEVPNVVAAYKKYHDKGFEIVGISLDSDKSALLAFTKEHDMTWPQYFDGAGWDNKISKGFGIDSIPAMWIVGKDGKVATTNGRDDLAGQVDKLLAAP